MDNGTVRDLAAEALAGLQSQLADIAAMQKKRDALKVNGKAAEGAVEVTVDARGQVTKTVIDKSYLDDHDFEELGGHVTEAARSAAAEAGRRVAEMMAPITEQHHKLPSLSDLIDGMPDLSDVMPSELDGFGVVPRRGAKSSAASDAKYDDGDGQAEFPAVRR